MKIHEVLESLYVSTNIQNQLEYSPYLKAKTTAIHELLNVIHSLCKFIAYFSIIYTVILIKTGIYDEPKAAKDLVEAYKTPEKVPNMD